MDLTKESVPNGQNDSANDSEDIDKLITIAVQVSQALARGYSCNKDMVSMKTLLP